MSAWLKWWSTTRLTGWFSSGWIERTQGPCSGRHGRKLTPLYGDGVGFRLIPCSWDLPEWGQDSGRSDPQEASPKQLRENPASLSSGY